jgi:hypothetical protein
MERASINILSGIISMSLDRTLPVLGPRPSLTYGRDSRNWGKLITMLSPTRIDAIVLGHHIDRQELIVGGPDQELLVCSP